MRKNKMIPAISLEEYCYRLECITQMVLAIHVAEVEGGGLPRGGYGLALFGLHEDLLSLLGDLQSLYTDSSEKEQEQ